MSDPTAVDPEEAFVASIASCHMLWFLAIAAREGLEVLSYEDNVTGEMEKRADGKAWIAKVVLKPRMKWGQSEVPDAARISELHHRAHEECFIANSVQ
ncbi:MAG: OsmC family protein, partial [Planctomycetota bacterium]